MRKLKNPPRARRWAKPRRQKHFYSDASCVSFNYTKFGEVGGVK